MSDQPEPVEWTPSERFRDLARRAGDDPMLLCDVTWTVDGEPHGCCLPPGHDGEHWCSCDCTLSA